MSMLCQGALQKALSLRQEYIDQSQEVKGQALQEFFLKHPHIEEVTISSQVLEGQYNYCQEILLAKCMVKRCGCLIPIPIYLLHNDAQLYSDIGELLLTLSLLKGVLIDGDQTFCRLNHVPS